MDCIECRLQRRPHSERRAHDLHAPSLLSCAHRVPLLEVRRRRLLARAVSQRGGAHPRLLLLLSCPTLLVLPPLRPPLLSSAPPLLRPAASTPPSFFRRSASRRASLRWTQRRPTTSGAPRTGARCPTPRRDLGEISAISRRDLGDASAISQPLPHRPLGTPTSLSSPRAVDRYTQPTTLALAAASSPDAAEALKALPAFYDAGGVTTQQFTAASADGTAARAPPPPAAGEGRGVVGRGEQLRAAPLYPRRAASGCQIWGDVARYGEVWSVAASRCRTSSSARRG